ncbi:unnamed protein product [Diabrotica balteata]|uniref:PIH1D1/2/3 CS-like domain-containing protein n=1 Tax=Diabrotica balteata TaxID=107213 RepID=A0A9N9SK35_DIABA|nr:unnamed protein product [Diabrotica balteata]
MSMDFCDIQKLTELFNPKQNNSDSEDDAEECVENKISKIEKQNDDVQNKINPYSKIETNKDKNKLLNPEYADALEDVQNEETTVNQDWKNTPVWDITYKQQVTASDVFLQMGFKNPTTASCEDMIVSVHLPGDSHYNMDLKIQKESLILISPNYYLDLRLPHPVDPQQGNAKWNNDTEKLVITLRMDRELDLVNF